MPRRKIDIKRVFRPEELCEPNKAATPDDSGAMDWARRVAEEEARGLD